MSSFGFDRERSGHGEHLLLAARERAGDLPPPLREAREAREGALEDVRERGAGVGRHAQVLHDREVREHAAALGHDAQAVAHEVVGASDPVIGVPSIADGAGVGRAGPMPP